MNITSAISYNSNSFDMSNLASASYNSSNTVPENLLGENLVSTEKLNNADINNIINNKSFDTTSNYNIDNQIHDRSLNTYKSNYLINQKIGNNLTYRDLIDDKFSNTVNNTITGNYLDRLNTASLDSIKNEPFWIDKPSILFTQTNFYSIFPTQKMSKFELLNSLTRFFVYLTILYIIFGKKSLFLVFPVIGIITIVTLYYIQRIDKNNLSLQTIIDQRNLDPDQLSDYLLNADKVEPTATNPFMNLTMKDMITDRDKKQNHGLDDITLKNIDNLFDNGLYKDVDDFYDKSTAKRQFYTTPCTTVINDQKNFANWLYRIPETCKENSVNCLRYEDIRYNRYNPNVDLYMLNTEN